VVVLSLSEFVWSLLILFFMIMYFMMLFQVIGDIFRRHDENGGKKALWLIFLLVAPFLSLFIYVLVNGQGMQERNIRDVQRSREAMDEHIRTVAGGGGAADEISQAKALLDSGAISQAEFEQLKAKALG
jgi:hypothetical protein